jgi:predicted dehydrogenase
VRVRPSTTHVPTDELGVGFVGAGNYASLYLIPHLQKNSGTKLIGLVTATGMNAQQKADKFGFDYCTTDLQPLLDDESINAVFIATRHSTHAEFATRALEAGKHVFVEKPMVVTPEQMNALQSAYEATQADRPCGLMVGLNRRFAPMVQTMREALPQARPKQMIYLVNSGPIDTDSWLHRPEEGGGMLVGEMCHFIDLMQFMCGERPTQVYAQSLTLSRNDRADHDNLSITITFDSGSVGTLCYNTVGDSAASKERFEVYGSGTVAALNDFRRLEITQDGSTSTSRAWNQDKGQANQMAATVDGFCVQGRAPIAFEELVAGMQVVFAARRSLQSGAPVELTPYQVVEETP